MIVDQNGFDQIDELINKEKEKCLREYLEELKDIAVAVAEKVIHISLRSSGSVISRMIEAETEKLQKMDWVKIYMEKEDYETMVQADGHLAEKLWPACLTILS